MKITGIEMISDSGVYSYQNTVGNVYAKAAGAEMVEESEDAGTMVQSAKLVVNATITISFTAE